MQLLRTVRFPTMSYEELSTEVKDSGILDPAELVEVRVNCYRSLELDTVAGRCLFSRVPIG